MTTTSTEDWNPGWLHNQLRRAREEHEGMIAMNVAVQSRHPEVRNALAELHRAVAEHEPEVLARMTTAWEPRL